MVTGKKFVLVKHFEGEPKQEDISLVDFEVSSVKDGEILAEAEYLSVDPYMRPYSTQLPIGSTMIGCQVAKIVKSENPKWPVGKRIVGNFGWVTHTVFNPDKMSFEQLVIKTAYILQDFGDLPVSLALGMLGMPGNAAYFGFLEICKPKAGETLVVSGAAGAVGSHVGQIAKILGLKVIGITGSKDKCKWLIDDLGFDHAINYKTDDLFTGLTKAAPYGEDCYFDNVGGEISSKVIYQMIDYGRVSVCGSISSYNYNFDMTPTSVPKGPVLLPAILLHQIKVEGFYVGRWKYRWRESIEKNISWIREGKLRYKESVTEGFENMFKAFTGMLKGENVGKAIVKI